MFILIYFLLDMSQFALEIFTPLFLLQECGILWLWHINAHHKIIYMCILYTPTQTLM